MMDTRKCLCRGGIALLLAALVAAPLAASDIEAPADGEAVEMAAVEQPATVLERLDAVEAELRLTLGHPYAPELSYCRAHPLGRKPCGGPAEYLVYSTLSTDEAALRDLVRRYNALAMVEGRSRRNEGGDCAYLPQPRLELRDSVCVAAD